MKTLYLLRHAKSSWKNEDLQDHERPLNKRGKSDTPKMGQWLAEQVKPPQLIICSDSMRTKATIAPIMESWGILEDKLKLDSRLYHASTETLWEIVQECPDEVERLLLVGHNPGLTEFANSLCPQFHTENIPTTGFVAFSFKFKKWAALEASEASFETYQYPKNL